MKRVGTASARGVVAAKEPAVAPPPWTAARWPPAVENEVIRVIGVSGVGTA